jgi:ATP-dependent Lon protease
MTEMPVLPLRELVVFPNSVMSLFVGRDKSIRAINAAMAQNADIFLVAQKDSKTNHPTAADLYETGTVAKILKKESLPDGTVKITVEGKKRAKIIKHLDLFDYFCAEVLEMNDDVQKTQKNEVLVKTLKEYFEKYAIIHKKNHSEKVLSIIASNSEYFLCSSIMSYFSIKANEKQKILELEDMSEKLEEVIKIVQRELISIKLERKIKSRVKKQVEKTQKEYYLNEQINAIQKELGNGDDKDELAELEKSAKNKKLSKEASEIIKKEIKKLKLMNPASAESAVVRNYIDNVLSLPWQEYRPLIADQNYSEDVLNADHYGLEKVKERIFEYLAIASLSDRPKGPILCLVGPPGVGKTSLAKSIAKATGRDFARIALGGVRDETEIRGHRRTYVGAMTGKIISAFKKTKTSNPLILLDEIDKMSSDFRGDPASAMLEVLDPEQNSTFNDHYLDMDYDLSQTLFLATANNLSTIPRPLLDRMEVISLGGYTEPEKLNIGLRHLVPKSIKANGLEKTDITFEESALHEIIRHYTREGGVRNLEREISSVCRKIARKLLKDNNIESSVVVTDESVKELLGPRKFDTNQANEQDEIGCVQGLAYTEVGGDLLPAEVSILDGKGNLKVTGKLGEVMQESAQIAFSCVRSRSKVLNLEKDFYSKIDIHVHFPEGAIPKDGPSAGITMATALVSALTQKAVRRDVAMTGEITLRGKVLPIGGLKEKLLAAHRGGVKKVIIPKENQKDLHEMPKNVLNDLEVVCVSSLEEVLLNALIWADDDAIKDNLKK